MVLTLDETGNLVKRGLKLEFNSTINSDCSWEGQAVIPEAYFPYKVTKWNAYAIYGQDKDRVYESLFPTPLDKFEQPNL